MSQNKKNQDHDIPTVFVFPSLPVLIDGFPESKIPILWGPNQTNCSINSYNPPAFANWRTLEQLNIPKVVRFIYPSGELGDDSDDDGGNTGDQRGMWKVTNFQYCAHDGQCLLGVTWTLQEVPFPYYVCLWNFPTLDFPIPYNTMVQEIPLGTERESTKPLPNCDELNG